MSLYEKISSSFINHGVQKEIVEKLMDEYQIIKKASLKSDEEKVSLHSAKFGDMSLALVKNHLTGTDINIDSVKTDPLVNELLGYPKNNSVESILSDAIPRVVRVMHVIRNKKDVAHVKSLSPDFFDIYFCEAVCDWVLSQFVCLISGLSVDEIKEIVQSIGEKKIPWIQEFEDGSSLLLINDLRLRDQILLVLYHYYPERLNAKQIADTILYENARYIMQFLGRMRKDKLVHVKTVQLIVD